MSRDRRVAGTERRAATPPLVVDNAVLRSENERLTRALQEAEEARDRVADLYDCAPFAYMTLDQIGLIRSINAVGARLLGTDDPRTLLGRRLRSFVAHEDRPLLQHHLTACRSGPEARTCELRVAAVGPPVPVQLWSRPVAHRPYLFNTALVDLRERRQAADERERLLEAEREARAASAAKDQFIAMLSHELRTPLTPVLAAVSSVRERTDLPRELRSLFEMFHRNVTAEARLIDDLLDVTRIARGKISLVREPADLHRVTCEAVETLRSEMEERRHQLVVDLAAGAHHVAGDPGRLRQVLWNLLRNAIKFTPPGGRIELRSWNNGRQIALEVSDTGQGFEPELAEALFSPFEQGRRPRAGGLGLGLAICKGLIELHGGRIVGASAGPGRGARFVIELEVVAAASAAVTATNPVVTAGPRPRILLVEDHPDTAETLQELLGEAGYQVQTAATVGSALAADLDNIDLVVSDIGLPDASGLDLMRRLAERPGIRGIALSGYGTEADVKASKDAGFSAHLTKPVDLDQLLAAINGTSGAGP
jgi:signal transduction histidine kinase